MRTNIESKLIEKFKSEYLDIFRDAFWYKIPDTHYLGGKKPFDVLIIYLGKIFCIEFKKNDEMPTQYQTECLSRAKTQGAYSYYVNHHNYRIMFDNIKQISLLRD